MDMEGLKICSECGKVNDKMIQEIQKDINRQQDRQLIEILSTLIPKF